MYQYITKKGSGHNARPTTKSELNKAATVGFQRLQQLIGSMTETEEQAVFQFEDRDKNLRDVLIHLVEWQRLLLGWIAGNQEHKGRPFLPAPYNWRTYGEMNVVFWQQHQATSLAAAKEMLQKSHQQVLVVLADFSDEELFSKKFFDWTGNSTLGSYFIANTSAHYDWAIKKIKKNLRLLREVKRL